MPELIESSLIQGVFVAKLKAFGDQRGRFTETFRKEWFPQRSWDIIQTNCSESVGGVVRGLHYHFKQVDYWCVMHGRIRAGLVDIRPNSPTFRATQTIDMDASDRLGLFIPVGVAHGFAGLSDDIILTYIVDNYYDSQDEFGIAWNDPDLALDWGLSDPIISPRDAANPLLRDVPTEKLPQ
ncbi:MAG: dTDP-4-dehydrorhamnose 3,5-epimerase family protein [Chloroflexi bacterium]|nr:dTDP-4-dehydrorhamnose 3,5-epimerase family protein [Chloroflexota bacterium]